MYKQRMVSLENKLIGLLKNKQTNKQTNKNYVNVRISYTLEHTRRVVENKLQFHQERLGSI